MTPRKIYVASSWCNEYYSEVVAKLWKAGHEVYDTVEQSLRILIAEQLWMKL